MSSSFLKDTLLGFVVLFTMLTLWHFAPEVIAVSLVAVAAVGICFLIGFIITLILGGSDLD